MSSALFRQLPKMDVLLESPALQGLPRDVCRTIAREHLETLRRRIADGELKEMPDVALDVAHRVEETLRVSLRAVINATGIVVHTNLGRAPWSDSVRDAAMGMTGYCDLEMDLDAGARGGRLDGVRRLLQALTGAEDALVVNNCAAAVLLALTALARDREVLVSRGELVEIGGSFRVPDVITSGGCTLREVGTTNRTRVEDYASAVGPATAVILSVHTSNFRVVGFTEATPREALVALGQEQKLYVVEDVGSGNLDGVADEPAVRDAVAAGVDVVLFSGDKLLGGPQAGFAVGKHEAIERLRRHALYRALRVDKVILAAAEQTLRDHLMGVTTPVQAMLRKDAEALRHQAVALAKALTDAGVACAVAAGTSLVGGGSMPGEGLQTSLVVVEHPRPDRLAKRLRQGEPPIVARVSNGALQFDVRTLHASHTEVIVGRMSALLNEGI